MLARAPERTTRAPSAERNRRQRSLSPFALPALILFTAFGLLPMAGVLLLSFTSWDGLGAIHASGLVSWRGVLSDPGLPQVIACPIPARRS